MVEFPNKRSKYVNTCGLPAIRGNLKYPAKFGASLQILPCYNEVDVVPYTMSKPDKCCTPCKGLDRNKINVAKDLFCPAGLEVSVPGILNYGIFFNNRFYRCAKKDAPIRTLMCLC